MNDAIISGILTIVIILFLVSAAFVLGYAYCFYYGVN